MKFYRLYVTFSLLCLAYNLIGQHQLAENKIDFSISNDTLTINSGRIVQQLCWSEKGFRTIRLYDPSNDKNDFNISSQSDFEIQGTTDKALCYDVFKKRTDLGTNVIEIVTKYEKVNVKRQLRAYPELPVIASDYHVKLNPEKGKVNFQTDHITLSSYRLQDDGHWKFRVVEFFDRTDENNNLVRETDLLGYSISSKIQGNVLIAQNSSNACRLFFIKEAPTPYSQNNYSGFDFELSKNEIKVGGAGIASLDLSQMEWVKAYGVVTGFGGTSDRELLSNMRKYWKCARPYNPDDDEMIMMNTWGDRNRDGRINEEFILSEL